MNGLDQPTRAWWFLHRVKHRRQSKRKNFKAWLSLEARAAAKHSHNNMAKKYVKILDSNGNYNETSRDEVNTKCASSYRIVVNKIQSA